MSRFRRSSIAILFSFAPVTLTTGVIAQSITVDGVKGSVTQTVGRIVHPGENVAVTIRPANLIVYSYTISVDNSDQLTAFIPPVVGATATAQTADNGGPFDNSRFAALFASTELETRSAAIDPSLIKMLQRDRKVVDQIFDDVMHAARAVNETERGIDATFAADVSKEPNWPKELDTTRDTFLVAAYGVPSSSARKDNPIDALRTLTGESRRDCDKDSFCGRIDRATTDLRELQNAIEDAKIADAVANPDTSKRQDFSLIEAAANALSTKLTSTAATVTATRDQVDRWQSVMKRYTKPELTQTIVIDRTSRRYVVTVTRRPLSAPQPPSGQTDPAIEKIATVMFEGHALSRFLISTGIALLRRPDIRTYEVQTQIDSNNNKRYYVEENSSSATDFKPVMSIGAYLSPVDSFDVDSRWKPHLFLSVGTELSNQPSAYLGGCGIDFPVGLSLNVGVTSYTATRLGKGYTPGQEIPSTGTGDQQVPIVNTSALPLRSTRKVGWYFSVQFRPAIFSAFRSLATN